MFSRPTCFPVPHAFPDRQGVRSEPTIILITCTVSFILVQNGLIFGVRGWLGIQKLPELEYAIR